VHGGEWPERATESNNKIGRKSKKKQDWEEGKNQKLTMKLLGLS
jgi:hypothetical protein